MNRNQDAQMLISAADDGGRRGLWKGPAIITALILLIPLLRNLYVQGWNWDIRGFLFVSAVGSLIFGVGLTFQLLIKTAASFTYRAAAGVALGTTFLLVWGNWVQAADDVNPNAVMYFAVPLVGLIGAALSRFRPNGMARAFFVTAIAQAIVLLIVLMIRNPQVTPWTAAVVRGFGANAFSAMLFAGSALLFRKSAREHAAAAE